MEKTQTNFLANRIPFNGTILVEELSLYLPGKMASCKMGPILQIIMSMKIMLGYVPLYGRYRLSFPAQHPSLLARTPT